MTLLPLRLLDFQVCFVSFSTPFPSFDETCSLFLSAGMMSSVFFQSIFPNLHGSVFFVKRHASFYLFSIFSFDGVFFVFHLFDFFPPCIGSPIFFFVPPLPTFLPRCFCYPPRLSKSPPSSTNALIGPLPPLDSFFCLRHFPVHSVEGYLPCLCTNSVSALEPLLLDVPHRFFLPLHLLR